MTKRTFPESLRRRSWSCFTSVLGGVLAYRGCEDLAFALESGYDFFFRPGPELRMASAGVWPGTEHPRPAANLSALFGVETKIEDAPDWKSVEDRILALDGRGEPLLLALSNHACGHIPRRDMAERVAHYLVLWRCHEGGVLGYDVFLDRGVTMTLDELRQGAEFVGAGGEEVCNRTCEIRLPERGAVDRPERRRLVAQTWMTRRLETLLPADGTLCGAAAVRALARQVAQIAAPTLGRELGSLFQSLRYVQYQRTCFEGYIRAVREVAGERDGRLEIVASGVREAAQEWFRLKMLMQYAALKGEVGLLPRLADRLLALADHEERLVEEMLALGRALS